MTALPRSDRHVAASGSRRLFAFSAEQQDAFRVLSGDLNPLHTDAEYARRTPFGREVVYGMALVLAALGQWAEGRPFRLRQVHGEFRKPLPVGVSCHLEIETAAGGGFEARWMRGESTVYARVGWQAAVVSPHASHQPVVTGAASGGVFVRLEPRPRNDVIPPSGGFETYPYSLRAGALERLTAFGLQPSQIETATLQAICGLSYLAGMELPGESALFVDFSCELDEHVPQAPGDTFEFRDLEWTYDDRFGTLNLLGAGTGLSSLRASVRSRPAPFHVTLQEIESAVGRSARLRNETVFVTGAGRGFGSVLARALALHGAEVIANARVWSPEAADIIREFEGAGLRARLSIGDVGDEQAVGAQADALLRRGVPLTGLVLNAWPPTRAERFPDFMAGEFEHEVLSGLRVTSVPMRALLPLLSPTGWAVSISSAYVAEPKAGFSHYAASKAAVERMFGTLAVEFPRRRFAVFRAPRMLTDSTNVGVSPASFESAPRAAARFLEQLGDPHQGRAGYEVWTFERQDRDER